MSNRGAHHGKGTETLGVTFTSAHIAALEDHQQRTGETRSLLIRKLVDFFFAGGIHV